MNEALLVAVGGLLHDIGKFVQRAKWSEKPGSHWVAGGEFLRHQIEAKPHLPEVFGKLPLFVEYHHNPRGYEGDVKMRNLLFIVSEADRISASERDKDKVKMNEDEIKFDVTNPLKSVLSSVYIGKGNTQNRFYKLTKFDPEMFFYPKEDVRVSEGDYNELFREFEKEFEKVLSQFDFNHLLYVLEKYTTFIPSMLVEWNDISLYDHLRTTSAIALCLYYYHEGELDRDISSRIRDRKEKRFLVVGGDVSGIQDFIYTITSKGALKYLRARSAFLELLVEDVVEEIVERLGLTRANIIYSGGGKFYILAPNTDKAKEEIRKILEKLNRWLFEKFPGKLYFAIDYIEVSGEELEKFELNGKNLWEVLDDRIKIRKLRKFLEELRDGKLVIEEIGEECVICKAPRAFVEHEAGNVCDPCAKFWVMGKELPEIEGFVRTKEDVAEGTFYEMPFSKIFALRSGAKVPKGSKVLVKNSFKIYSGATSIPYYVCDFLVRKEDGDVMDFDDLAKTAKGSEKIGVLRMDVDDLGKIFSCGLRGKEGTFSRVATLSRFLNNFFKNVLRSLLEGKLNEHLSENLPKLSTRSGKRKVVVVYSGGDDLFVVGAWDQVFEVAFEIWDLFRKYVGYNPNITISAGIGIFSSKYPLYRMARVTGDREEWAKEEGERIGEFECGERKIEIKRKGRIFVLDDLEVRRPAAGCGRTFKISYEWEEFVRTWREYVSKIYDSDTGNLKNGVPRALVGKILEVRSVYLSNPSGLKWHYLLSYYLSRHNGALEVLEELLRRDPEKIRKGEPLDIFLVGIPLKIVDLAVRG